MQTQKNKHCLRSEEWMNTLRISESELQIRKCCLNDNNYLLFGGTSASNARYLRQEYLYQISLTWLSVGIYGNILERSEYIIITFFLFSGLMPATNSSRTKLGSGIVTMTTSKYLHQSSESIYIRVVTFNSFKIQYTIIQKIKEASYFVL